MRHFHPGQFHCDPRLVALVRDLSSAGTVPEISAIVTHAARCMIGAEGVTFVLRDEDRCYYADEDAISPLWKGQRFPAAACISGWCMIHRETVVLEDIYADTRIPADAYRPTFVQSLVMVPVRRVQPIAAIGAYWRHRHQATDEEVALLQAIADAASLAISHAELQHTQIQLQAAKEQAERSERSKANFLAAVSHDLRQPLQAMGMFLSVLKQSAGEEAGRVLALLDGALASCHDLTAGLSEFARLESLAAHPRPFPLQPLLAQVAAETAAAATNGTDFRWVATSRKAFADPELVARIMRNLLSNALKFATGRRVLLGCRRRADQISIEVWDSGRGIAPSEIDRVFDDFYRSDTSTAGGTPGLGLGLPTVRRLAAATGGSVIVRSWPGRGSVFALRLPLAPPAG